MTQQDFSDDGLRDGITTVPTTRGRNGDAPAPAPRPSGLIYSSPSPLAYAIVISCLLWAGIIWAMRSALF